MSKKDIVYICPECGAEVKRVSTCSKVDYILFAVSAALLIGAIIFAEVVTERAENVSHETIAPHKETVQQMAEPPAESDALAGEASSPRLYTDADAVALAQMAWGECRGVEEISTSGGIVSGTYQKAAAMWCALNRYDTGAGESIADVVAAPRQFHGYDPEHPISEELLALAYDVLDRWEAEKAGAADVGRTLPAEYLFFVGDGENNYFSVEYRSGDYYTWELPDVYM